jgi:hypothetical protein
MDLVLRLAVNAAALWVADALWTASAATASRG